jgi:hypothetical protein
MQCRLVLTLAIAAALVSCEKRAQPPDSSTNDAKLRPEVAAAKQGASPTPLAGETGANATPSP